MGFTEYSALIGVLVPIIVAFITNTETSSKVKGLFALGLSVLVGTGTAYFNGAFIGINWGSMEVVDAVLTNIMIVAVAAQTAYTMFIKPTGLAEKIQADLGYKDKYDLDEYSTMEDVSEFELEDEEDFELEDELEETGD